MSALILGASGCVGRSLMAELAARGEDVMGVSRCPSGLDHSVVAMNALDVTSTRGFDTVYFLVHSLSARNYASRDREIALHVGRVAAASGSRIVYLGALGSGRLSGHIRSRREVGEILSRHAETVEVRAPMILDGASLSFQILRVLAEEWRPWLRMPRKTPCSEPIALVDAVRYLIFASSQVGGVYEIGGGDELDCRALLNQFPTFRGDLDRGYVPIARAALPLWALILSRKLHQPYPLIARLLQSLDAHTHVADYTLMERAGFKPMAYREAAFAALNSIQACSASRSSALRDRELA